MFTIDCVNLDIAIYM